MRSPIHTYNILFDNQLNFQSIFDLELIKREQAEEKKLEEEKKKKEKEKEDAGRNNDKEEKNAKEHADKKTETKDTTKEGCTKTESKKINPKPQAKTAGPNKIESKDNGVNSSEDNQENKPELDSKGKQILRENLYKDFLSKVIHLSLEG